MSDLAGNERDPVGRWRDLGSHFGTVVVLAGGVLVGAINIYLTASLLPTVVEDIGGERLYAWSATIYLCGQAVATMLVGQLLSRRGNRSSYLIGFGMFAVGSVICAVSPTMLLLLLGRGVQGVAAGLLTGLGFGLIHTTLPRHLWLRGTALVSAMFGVGNLVGPAAGGLFAQWGSWRAAFIVLGLAAVTIAAFVPRSLPPGRVEGPSASVPVIPLGLAITAIGAMSLAGVVGGVVLMAASLTAAFLLVGAFIWAEKRTTTPILPASTYRPGSPLRWLYLSILLLASGVAVETFLPLFGQRIGGLSPVGAGFLAAALSFGWSMTQLASSSMRARQMVHGFHVAGPGVLAAAFALLAVLQVPDAPLAVVIAWPIVLLVGGAGIGLAMPHLSVAAMATVDPAEANQAGAAIATLLTMSTAVGSALAGLLVNAGGPDMVTSARCLLVGFAAVAALGVFTAICANRQLDHHAAQQIASG
ncbi:MFS transporter [Mycobacterium sp. NPDC004974]